MSQLKNKLHCSPLIGLGKVSLGTIEVFPSTCHENFLSWLGLRVGSWRATVEQIGGLNVTFVGHLVETASCLRLLWCHEPMTPTPRPFLLAPMGGDVLSMVAW